MNEIKKLTDNQLSQLDEALNTHAWQNFDAHVSLEQDARSVLDIRFINKDDVEETHITASWVSTIQVLDGESRIYAFFDENAEDPAVAIAHMSLNPRAIIGLLTL